MSTPRKPETPFCLAAMLLACCLVAPRASAAVEKELLDVLLSNGAITQEQYETLLGKEDISRDDVEDIVVNLDKKGLNIESGDGAYQIHIGARLHADGSYNAGSLPPGDDPTNGTELRRARLEMKGLIQEDWPWTAEVDFGDDEVAVKDFWLGYAGLEGWTFMIGNQKQPYNLQLEMSSNDIPFIERSIDNDLVAPFVDRAIGIRTDTSGKNWFLAGGLFGQAVEPDTSNENEGWAAVSRFVYAPIHDERRTVHLGVRGAYRHTPDPNDTVRVRTETTHMSNLYPLNTGFIDDVEGVWLVGPEAAVAYGPFWLSGGYTHAFLSRDDRGTLNFDGFHVETTWSLTGESRAAAYKMSAGEFKRLTPAHDFRLNGGGLGAWELALRYAYLDVNGGGVDGGKGGTLTAGVNWYVNTNIRFLLDWTYWLHTSGDTALQRDAQGLNVVQFRAQFSY